MKDSLYEAYMDKRVVIKHTDKIAYRKYNLAGKVGTVIKTSGSEVGVLVDGEYNTASAYGAYWFTTNEIKFLKNESEDIKMEGYKNIAIVNLLEDYNNKDYGFALYDEDFDMIIGIGNENPEVNVMVVVNAKGKNNRVLGIVKEVMPIENYKGAKPTAEVVGVVAMNGYIAREAEKVRLAELEKKKAAIEKELEAEINKRKSIEYYEAMAKEYSDNPKLAELVKELKSLGA